MRFVRLLWITTRPGRAWVGSVTNKHNPSTKSGLGACISQTISMVIHVKNDHQINYNCFNEPFAVSPYRSLYWDMHGLIFETSIWLLAGSTRLMELHTNRAAKHRYGKQRCKTSSMTVSYENKNLQIRSMFDAEPTSAELISSRKRFVKRPCHQWNTQASNATHTSMALEKRTPNTTHPRSSRIAPARMRWQFNQARRDAKTPIREIAKKKQKKTPLPLFHQKNQKNEPTSLKRSRVHAQLNDGFWHQRWTSTPVPKKLDRFRSVLWPHTPHRHDTFGMTICIQHGQLDIWIDLEMISLFGGQELLNTEICWKSRCSFFFLISVKEGEERRSNVR